MQGPDYARSRMIKEVILLELNQFSVGLYLLESGECMSCQIPVGESWTDLKLKRPLYFHVGYLSRFKQCLSAKASFLKMLNVAA